MERSASREEVVEEGRSSGRRAPMERPRIGKSTAALILAGCLLAGCLSVTVGLCVLRDPVEASRRLYRWRLGGELLGTRDVVLQEYRNDCGPAALKMILEYYGITISLEECRKEVGLKPGGTSMLHLLETAERHGIRARGMRYDLRHFEEIPTPLIAYLRIGHFVVVEEIDCKRRQIIIKDPAVGRLRLSADELSSLWRGASLVFQPLSKALEEPATSEGPDLRGTMRSTRLHVSRAGRPLQ